MGRHYEDFEIESLIDLAFKDGYKKGKKDAFNEFLKTEADTLRWLIKRQKEGYGTICGELIDHIYGIAETMKGRRNDKGRTNTNNI